MTALCTFLLGPAHAQDRLIACGAEQVFVLALQPDQAPPKRSWSWQAADSPEITPDFHKRFRSTDECKPVEGDKLLITSSSDGVALIRRSDKACLFLATARNAHSACLLPDNRIAVAASTGGDELIVFERSGKPGAHPVSGRIPLKGAHGVHWMADRERLLALGEDELLLLDAALQVEQRWELPSHGGHDLSPCGDGRFFVTTNTRVYRFDPASGIFARDAELAREKIVKSVDRHPKSGRIVYHQGSPKHWWSDTIRFTDGKTIQLEGERLYKIRWDVTSSLTIVARNVTPRKQLNLLFLLSDDQRPDTIAALGNPHIQTPHLDALVRRGTAIRGAICANPICTPSRAELLTGCSGFTNGIRDFGGAIKEGLPRWPRHFAEAGYRTVHVGKWHVRGRPSEHGFQESFGLYAGGGRKWMKEQQDWRGQPVTGYKSWIFQDDSGKAKYPEHGVGLTPDISARFADAAIEGLAADRERPFFMQVNFTAPHDPLLMPPGYEKRYDPAKIPLPPNFMPRHPFDHGNLEGRDEVLLPFPRTPELVKGTLAMYYRVLTHMDEQIGRILTALERDGRLENTLVIFSSDHGLGVGSHGLRGKQNMYAHTINVPLVFAGPGLAAGKVLDADAYLRDLFPTTATLCGLRAPVGIDGKCLAPLLRGEVEQVHQQVFGYFRDKQRMIRRDGWKLIHYPAIDRWQLFDLQSDPHEIRNLSGEVAHAEKQADLTKKLRAWQQAVGD